ncbi:MAG: tRNA (N(6)-L-threonylcarbamoyladenosine(37)-C(2))-methylthiotransferase MtaB [Clostridia bacterium]|nr:tRNA (N(6)-L-threonylcarbamoyladenosine(37)-C(2))-methylthiotransferase MtaB [Clostridia bacterium]
MKIVVYNLGCKVNQYECDSLVKALQDKGHDVKEDLEYADAYILNTCAVTNEAERKSRQCIERCLKFNKDAKIYVCGCASQNNQKQFLEKDNVQYVIGTANKMSLVDSFDKQGENVEEMPTVYEDDFTPSINRTRAYIKVQDGCNRFCTYCLIPYVRGRSRSRQIESVKAECERLAKLTKEIVITGIDLSFYGKDINTSFVELIKSLKDVDCRIRLGSLEVSLITDELLQALKGMKAFCPQFHLSLQSGSDTVLKRMNRHYTTKEFEAEVNLIRKYFKDAAISTDIIFGFPKESDEEFKETLAFMEKIGFMQVHIFPYSKREGTVAAKLPQVDGNIKKQRCKEAEKLAFRLKQEYLTSMLGKELEVLFEEKHENYFEGYSREYIRVKIKDANINEIVKCKAICVDDDCIIAEV